MSNEVEIWLRMYEEQTRHIRHHETLRANATSYILAISAAALGLFTTDAIEVNQGMVIPLLIVILNLYGFFMSLKHYERSRLHHTVSSRYRDVISKYSGIADRVINDERQIGVTEHGREWRFISRIRLYVFWSVLHLVLVAFGGVLMCTSL